MQVYEKGHRPHALEPTKMRCCRPLTCRRRMALSTTASSSSWRRLNSVDIRIFEILFLLRNILMSSARSKTASCTSSIRTRATSPVALPAWMLIVRGSGWAEHELGRWTLTFHNSGEIRPCGKSTLSTMYMYFFSFRKDLTTRGWIQYGGHKNSKKPPGQR